ncbi:hypothetical protein C0991_004637 [Blastosporella zonata]|nr:hypothetical protein C0991_004637 [Blastosporella zonata]
MQAFIGAHSKSHHYDPTKPDEDTVAHCENQFDFASDDEKEGSPVLVPQHNEIGLICTITVKECLSAKWKYIFHKLQGKAGLKPQQLLVDMKFIELFLCALVQEEKDCKKRQKLTDLIPTKTEWSRVSTFLDLLTHAENAQHAFSSNQGPSLHLAIPALESLCKAWSSRKDRDKYTDFRDALEAGVDKIVHYYDRTSESEVYTFVMLLDPELKSKHLKKHWGDDLTTIALEQAEYTLNASHYPGWASLAHDYLEIMALLVSSEWAFSSAGITISKRRN